MSGKNSILGLSEPKKKPDILIFLYSRAFKISCSTELMIVNLQDEPLPHELRPISVLQMTMTYLLCEVADQGQDGYWGDWFDFLWNRTRGIRKVI